MCIIIIIIIHGQVQEGLDHGVDVVGAAEVVTSDVDDYGVVTTRYMLLNHCPQPGDVRSGKIAVLDVPAITMTCTAR